MCTFTVISDECIKAFLFVSESQVLISLRCRLRPSFRDAEQVGSAQPSCHLVSCQIPPPHQVPPCTSEGEDRMLVPATNYGVRPVVENETGRLVWWTVPEVSGILHGVPVLQGIQEMGYLRVNCCFYCPWLPKGAAGVLVWTLPSSPSSVVLFIWLVSGSEL